MSRRTPALLALALAACAPAQAPQTCGTDADCRAGDRCRASLCATNAPPVARLYAPTSPVTFALVAVSGADSFDPDPEDAVVAHHWTVRSAGAACEPPVVAGTSASVSVRFGCEGAYEMELVVEDGFGARSAPAVVPVDVKPDGGAPAVTAGADASTGHACAGSPLRCKPDTANGTVALASTGPVGAGITYVWTVQPPPGRDLGPGRRVIFTPGSGDPDPTVRIETDGLGISGDWVFRVEARDAAGAVGAATQRVSIGNRPPVLTSTPGPTPHAYDPAAKAYVASGAVFLGVADPDGDPLQPRAVSFHHAGDGPSATFSGTDDGDRISYAVVVPDDGVDAQGRLIGGPGLSRSVQLQLADVNDAQVSQTWDVLVANREPVLAAPVAPVSADHTYASGSYRAQATLSTWLDPDGDPLALDGAAVPPCDLSLANGAVVATCTVAFTGTPDAAAIAGTRSLPHAVRDPWAPGQLVNASLTVLDRAPTFTRTGFTARGACGLSGGCCQMDPDTDACLVAEQTWGGGSVSVDLVDDADGDPIAVGFTSSEVAVSPAGAICTPGACAFTFQPPDQVACGIKGSHVQATVSDGAAGATSTLTVARGCL